MDTLRSFLSLSLGDKLRLVTAAALLFVIQGGLVVVSFDRLRSVLVALGTFARRINLGRVSERHIAGVVETADTHLPGERTCLVRSLTAAVLLRAYDHSFEHRIGINKSGDSVNAHSWIECEDEVLIGDIGHLDEYRPLPPLNDGESQ